MSWLGALIDALSPSNTSDSTNTNGNNNQSLLAVINRWDLNPTDLPTCQACLENIIELWKASHLRSLSLEDAYHPLTSIIITAVNEHDVEILRTGLAFIETITRPFSTLLESRQIRITPEELDEIRPDQVNNAQFVADLAMYFIPILDYIVDSPTIIYLQSTTLRIFSLVVQLSKLNRVFGVHYSLNSQPFGLVSPRKFIQQQQQKQQKQSSDQSNSTQLPPRQQLSASQMVFQSDKQLDQDVTLNNTNNNQRGSDEQREYPFTSPIFFPIQVDSLITNFTSSHLNLFVQIVKDNQSIYLNRRHKCGGDIANNNDGDEHHNPHMTLMYDALLSFFFAIVNHDVPTTAMEELSMVLRRLLTKRNGEENIVIGNEYEIIDDLTSEQTPTSPTTHTQPNPLETKLKPQIPSVTHSTEHNDDQDTDMAIEMIPILPSISKPYIGFMLSLTQLGFFHYLLLSTLPVCDEISKSHEQFAADCVAIDGLLKNVKSGGNDDHDQKAIERFDETLLTRATQTLIDIDPVNHPPSLPSTTSTTILTADTSLHGLFTIITPFDSDTINDVIHIFTSINCIFTVAPKVITTFLSPLILYTIVSNEQKLLGDVNLHDADGDRDHDDDHYDLDNIDTNTTQPSIKDQSNQMNNIQHNPLAPSLTTLDTISSVGTPTLSTQLNNNDNRFTTTYPRQSKSALLKSLINQYRDSASNTNSILIYMVTILKRLNDVVLNVGTKYPIALIPLNLDFSKLSSIALFPSITTPSSATSSIHKTSPSHQGQINTSTQHQSTQSLQSQQSFSFPNQYDQSTTTVLTADLRAIITFQTLLTSHIFQIVTNLAQSTREPTFLTDHAIVPLTGQKINTNFQSTMSLFLPPLIRISTNPYLSVRFRFIALETIMPIIFNNYSNINYLLSFKVPLVQFTLPPADSSNPYNSTHKLYMFIEEQLEYLGKSVQHGYNQSDIDDNGDDDDQDDHKNNTHTRTQAQQSHILLNDPTTTAAIYWSQLYKYQDLTTHDLIQLPSQFSALPLDPITPFLTHVNRQGTTLLPNQQSSSIQDPLPQPNVMSSESNTQQPTTPTIKSSTPKMQPTIATIVPQSNATTVTSSNTTNQFNDNVKLVPILPFLIATVLDRSNKAYQNFTPNLDHKSLDDILISYSTPSSQAPLSSQPPTYLVNPDNYVEPQSPLNTTNTNNESIDFFYKAMIYNDETMLRSWGNILTTIFSATSQLAPNLSNLPTLTTFQGDVIKTGALYPLTSVFHARYQQSGPKPTWPTRIATPPVGDLARALVYSLAYIPPQRQNTQQQSQQTAQAVNSSTVPSQKGQKHRDLTGFIMQWVGDMNFHPAHMILTSRILKSNIFPFLKSPTQGNTQPIMEYNSIINTTSSTGQSIPQHVLLSHYQSLSQTISFLSTLFTNRGDLIPLLFGLKIPLDDNEYSWATKVLLKHGLFSLQQQQPKDIVKIFTTIIQKYPLLLSLQSDTTTSATTSSSPSSSNSNIPANNTHVNSHYPAQHHPTHHIAHVHQSPMMKNTSGTHHDTNSTLAQTFYDFFITMGLDSPFLPVTPKTQAPQYRPELSQSGRLLADLEQFQTKLQQSEHERDHHMEMNDNPHDDNTIMGYPLFTIFITHLLHTKSEITRLSTTLHSLRNEYDVTDNEQSQVTANSSHKSQGIILTHRKITLSTKIQQAAQLLKVLNTLFGGIVGLFAELSRISLFFSLFLLETAMLSAEQANSPQTHPQQQQPNSSLPSSPTKNDLFSIITTLLSNPDTMILSINSDVPTQQRRDEMTSTPTPAKNFTDPFQRFPNTPQPYSLTHPTPSLSQGQQSELCLLTPVTYSIMIYFVSVVSDHCMSHINLFSTQFQKKIKKERSHRSHTQQPALKLKSVVQLNNTIPVQLHANLLTITTSIGQQRRFFSNQIVYHNPNGPINIHQSDPLFATLSIPPHLSTSVGPLNNNQSQSGITQHHPPTALTFSLNDSLDYFPTILNLARYLLFTNQRSLEDKGEWVAFIASVLITDPTQALPLNSTSSQQTITALTNALGSSLHSEGDLRIDRSSSKLQSVQQSQQPILHEDPAVGIDLLNSLNGLQNNNNSNKNNNSNTLPQHFQTPSRQGQGQGQNLGLLLTTTATTPRLINSSSINRTPSSHPNPTQYHHINQVLSHTMGDGLAYTNNTGVYDETDWVLSDPIMGLGLSITTLYPTTSTFSSNTHSLSPLYDSSMTLVKMFMYYNNFVAYPHVNQYQIKNNQQQQLHNVINHDDVLYSHYPIFPKQPKSSTQKQQQTASKAFPRTDLSITPYSLTLSNIPVHLCAIANLMVNDLNITTSQLTVFVSVYQTYFQPLPAFLLASPHHISAPQGENTGRVQLHQPQQQQHVSLETQQHVSKLESQVLQLQQELNHLKSQQQQSSFSNEAHNNTNHGNEDVQDKNKFTTKNCRQCSSLKVIQEQQQEQFTLRMQSLVEQLQQQQRLTIGLKGQLHVVSRAVSSGINGSRLEKQINLLAETITQLAISPQQSTHKVANALPQQEQTTQQVFTPTIVTRLVQNEPHSLAHDHSQCPEIVSYHTIEKQLVQLQEQYNELLNVYNSTNSHTSTQVQEYNESYASLTTQYEGLANQYNQLLEAYNATLVEKQHCEQQQQQIELNQCQQQKRQQDDVKQYQQQLNYYQNQQQYQQEQVQLMEQHYQEQFQQQREHYENQLLQQQQQQQQHIELSTHRPLNSTPTKPQEVNDLQNNQEQEQQAQYAPEQYGIVPQETPIIDQGHHDTHRVEEKPEREQERHKQEQSTEEGIELDINPIQIDIDLPLNSLEDFSHLNSLNNLVFHDADDDTSSILLPREIHLAYDHPVDDMIINTSFSQFGDEMNFQTDLIIDEPQVENFTSHLPEIEDSSHCEQTDPQPMIENVDTTQLIVDSTLSSDGSVHDTGSDISMNEDLNADFVQAEPILNVDESTSIHLLNNPIDFSHNTPNIYLLHDELNFTMIDPVDLDKPFDFDDNTMNNMENNDINFGAIDFNSHPMELHIDATDLNSIQETILLSQQDLIETMSDNPLEQESGITITSTLGPAIIDQSMDDTTPIDFNQPIVTLDMDDLETHSIDHNDTMMINLPTPSVHWDERNNVRSNEMENISTPLPINEEEPLLIIENPTTQLDESVPIDNDITMEMAPLDMNLHLSTLVDLSSIQLSHCQIDNETFPMDFNHQNDSTLVPTDHENDRSLEFNTQINPEYIDLNQNYDVNVDLNSNSNTVYEQLNHDIITDGVNIITDMTANVSLNSEINLSHLDDFDQLNIGMTSLPHLGDDSTPLNLPDNLNLSNLSNNEINCDINCDITYHAINLVSDDPINIDIDRDNIDSSQFATNHHDVCQPVQEEKRPSPTPTIVIHQPPSFTNPLNPVDHESPNEQYSLTPDTTTTPIQVPSPPSTPTSTLDAINYTTILDDYNTNDLVFVNNTIDLDNVNLGIDSFFSNQIDSSCNDPLSHFQQDIQFNDEATASFHINHNDIDFNTDDITNDMNFDTTSLATYPAASDIVMNHVAINTMLSPNNTDNNQNDGDEKVHDITFDLNDNTHGLLINTDDIMIDHDTDIIFTDNDQIVDSFSPKHSSAMNPQENQFDNHQDLFDGFHIETGDVGLIGTNDNYGYLNSDSKMASTRTTTTTTRTTHHINESNNITQTNSSNDTPPKSTILLTLDPPPTQPEDQIVTTSGDINQYHDTNQYHLNLTHGFDNNNNDHNNNNQFTSPYENYHLQPPPSQQYQSNLEHITNMTIDNDNGFNDIYNPYGNDMGMLDHFSNHDVDLNTMNNIHHDLIMNQSDISISHDMTLGMNDIGLGDIDLVDIDHLNSDLNPINMNHLDGTDPIDVNFQLISDLGLDLQQQHEQQQQQQQQQLYNSNNPKTTQSQQEQGVILSDENDSFDMSIFGSENQSFTF